MRRFQDDDDDGDIEGGKKKDSTSIEASNDSSEQPPNKKTRVENDVISEENELVDPGESAANTLHDMTSTDPGAEPSTMDTTTATISNEGNTTKDTSDSSAKPTGDSKKNPYDLLRWTIVKNDGRPESLIKLVALKSLFAKQLPKMPKAYIARLVFERRHVSLVILSDDPRVKDTDKEVIGAICYRPFPEMRFAEIAFCAVNSDHQVKVGRNTEGIALLVFCCDSTHFVKKRTTPITHAIYNSFPRVRVMVPN